MTDIDSAVPADPAQASGAMLDGDDESFTPNWAPDAPRGGKVVLNRILKDSAAVPLFFAQTFIQSLRDVGYNTTTSALEEHVDNAIQAGATEIRVYFHQSGTRGSYQTDILVYDNGRGMPPNVLKVATSFGGSMSYGNRDGIGRFGMGMKTAALSMSPVMELYSWQEPRAVYGMVLDTGAIGRERTNVIELPDPRFCGEVPPEVSHILSKAMSFPRDRSEQSLLAPSEGELWDRLGSSGTIVYMPECDRLSFATDRKLVDHATKEMARVYRRAIAGGLKLFINNRRVEAFDPTYSMPVGRHRKVPGLKEYSSRLVVKKEVPIPLGDGRAEVGNAIVKIFMLPMEEWADLPRKVQKNDLHIFDGLNVSILRNDREVFAGFMSDIAPRHSAASWYRIEIDFSGDLDEAFGVAANKQGVRPKSFVFEAINKAVGEQISALVEEIKRFQSKRATERRGSAPTSSETRASDADAFLSDPLDVSLTETEAAQMDANLRGLAVALKRDGENDEEAFERIKNSKYIIGYRSDEYWPFYHVDHKFGRVILTINTAHPFFSELYEPLLKMGAVDDADEDQLSTDTTQGPEQRGPVVALELLLLSLARAQSVLTRDNADAGRLFESFRRSWSETYRVQLTA